MFLTGVRFLPRLVLIKTTPLNRDSNANNRTPAPGGAHESSSKLSQGPLYSDPGCFVIISNSEVYLKVFCTSSCVAPTVGAFLQLYYTNKFVPKLRNFVKRRSGVRNYDFLSY